MLGLYTNLSEYITTITSALMETEFYKVYIGAFFSFDWHNHQYIGQMFTVHKINISSFGFSIYSERNAGMKSACLYCCTDHAFFY